MTTLISLDNLQMNKNAKIDSLCCNSSIRRRLLDLGFVPDTNITPIFKSVSGDPTAFEIRGTIIALRKEDARDIWVKV
ncbi:MAG: ferrous iron transport protein A [Clostridia bacterium]|nr:ferrous iron transport protein A [Clostridia bacterium]